MSRSAQEAVSDYLFSMFNDSVLSENVQQQVTSYEAMDSIPAERRLCVGMDSYSFMSLTFASTQHQRYLAFLCILNLSMSIPAGKLQQYCIRQCQTLSLAQRSLHYE